MKKYVFNDYEYELIEDDDCFIYNDVVMLVTDYFIDFDYIFGDFAYEKLRLKGFNDATNKKTTRVNDIKYLNEYKNDYCSYGAKTFLLKRIK